MSKKRITKQTEDYAQWYLDVIEAADLAQNSPVRGCMIIMPHGYAIWENIQEILDKMIKDTGHTNAYFPIFIPKSFLTKEAEHVKGFAKECAVVTHHRLKEDAQGNGVEVDPDAKLQEELIVRPTSETIIYDAYARWIHSWRDLPILLNQWANAVRWEMRTRPFLRTAEFLWQEGHTAHATMEEADREARKMLSVYQTLAEEYLAIPVIAGTKPEAEKFAGAHTTYTIEAIMQDGKALQAGTSHNLGQNFAKAFHVMYTDKEGNQQYVAQTSWGLSTRIIGGLIMTHSDDRGLVLPPKIAPIQVIIVPIIKDEERQEAILSIANNIYIDLKEKGVKVQLDTRDYHTIGEKIFEWEKKGVPLRIEIGSQEIDNNLALIARRDTYSKEQVSFEGLSHYVTEMLQTIQHDLLKKAQERISTQIVSANTWEEFREKIEAGYAVMAHWDGKEQTEAIIQEKTGASIRCIPFDANEESGTCIYTGATSHKRVLFAKAY